MSPWISPSTWISPFEVTLPVIVRSSPMIEGTILLALELALGVGPLPIGGGPLGERR